MYQKVDKTYEDARIRRETAANRFRSICVDKSKRELPAAICKKLQNLSPTINEGYLVTVVLNDGRRIENVFIGSENEILGIYNEREFTFEGKNVVAIEPTGMSKPPHFTPAQWLRLDGVQAPE